MSAKDGNIIRLRIPCASYPESYTLFYNSLSKAWLGRKFTN